MMPLYWEALWGSFVGASVWEAGKGSLIGPATTGGESLVQETRLRRPRSRSVLPGTSRAGTADSINPVTARHE